MATILTIPMCCMCKQVADRAGSSEVWMKLKRFQDQHYLDKAELQFSHTYCPSCYKRQARAWRLPLVLRALTSSSRRAA
jgi:hypothetical protein